MYLLLLIVDEGVEELILGGGEHERVSSFKH